MNEMPEPDAQGLTSSDLDAAADPISLFRTWFTEAEVQTWELPSVDRDWKYG